MHAIPHDRPVFLYHAPIHMQWRPKRVIALCAAANPTHPRQDALYLFFNANRDQLKLVFFDDGYRQYIKWLPRGSCMLPPPVDGEAFSPIKRSTLDRILSIRNISAPVEVMPCGLPLM